MEVERWRPVRTRLLFDRRGHAEELWDGPHPADDVIRREHAIDEVVPSSQLGGLLEEGLCRRSSRTLLVADPTGEDSAHSIPPSIATRTTVEPLSPHLDKLRLVKSPAEQEAMRKAGRIGGVALAAAIASGEKSEGALAARLALEYARRGADGPAYPPVVARGENACTVHYLHLKSPLEDGDAVLIDAGAEVSGYLSDISRVYPVNGNFTPAQKIIYDLLETVQLTLIEEAKQGDLVLNSLFSTMLHLLGQSLQEAGVLRSNLSPREMERAVDRLSLHHVGHYLGLDVHDSPTVPRNIRMPPGAVFTIEPGLYIRRGDTDVHPEFHGIGMRIEDDILVEKGDTVSVLTDSCPKAIEDIERLVRYARGQAESVDKDVFIIFINRWRSRHSRNFSP